MDKKNKKSIIKKEKNKLFSFDVYSNKYQNKANKQFQKFLTKLQKKNIETLVKTKDYTYNENEMKGFIKKIINGLQVKQTIIQGHNPYNDTYKNSHKKISKYYIEIINNSLKSLNKSNFKKMEKIFQNGILGNITKQEMKKQLTNNFVKDPNNSYSVKWVRFDGTIIRNPTQYTKAELDQRGAYKKKIPSKSSIQHRKIDQLVDDCVHTSVNNNSLQNALELGYKYKIWVNGRSRTKTRAWHLASGIQPVHIDEPFEVFGSFKAYMMYPGELTGGDENVANCHCGMEFTDKKPDNLKPRGEQATGKILEGIEKHNIKSHKKDYKNSLSPKQIHGHDSDFTPNVMSKESKKAQYIYSKNSVIFNEFFTEYKKKTLLAIKELGKTIKDIEIMINDLKKSMVTTDKDYIVSRGVQGKFDVGMSNQSKGFMSTSLDPAISKGYVGNGGDVIFIKVPKGSKVMYLRGNSKFPNHMEILISYEDYKLVKAVPNKSYDYILKRK